MKVSIIVPFYRGERYLTDCLDSLAEYASKEVEVLLVLDQGAKEVKELLEQYGKRLTLRVFWLPEGKNVAAARNLGVKNARGEYLLFVDSDDYLDAPVSILYSAAEAANADVVYGSLERSWYQRELYRENIAPPAASGQREEEANISLQEDRTNYYTKGYEHQYRHYSSQEQTAGAGGEHQKAECFLAAHELFVQRKDIRDVRIVNLLIRRAFWEKEKLCFDERLHFFTDLPVVLKILQKGKMIKKAPEFRYVKRRHNDPVNLPSLSQQSFQKGFDERLLVYRQCMEATKARFFKKQLELKIVNYAWNEFLTGLWEKPVKEQKQEIKVWMQQLLPLFEKMTLLSGDFFSKERNAFYMAVRCQDEQRVLRLARKMEWRHRLKLFSTSRLEIGKYVYSHYLVKLPIRSHVIMFESFSGKNYSDSPKYISEYINARYGGKYRLVWAVNQKEPPIAYPYRKVKRYSMAYLYYLAVSRYFVFNGRQAGWMKKRDGQVFLETWHGTPLKKLFFDMEDVTSATPTCKQEVYEQTKDWDYLISPNAFSSKIFRRCFQYENVLLESGYPRNDLLHAKDRNVIAGWIKKKLGLPEGKKAILYAPTWRDDEYYTSGRYKFKLQLDLEQMREQLGDAYVLLLRPHYYIADTLDTAGYEGFAYNVSTYEDISELYLISELLVTDYSSVFFDYANLKRPMIFFAYDLEKYRDLLRGFYIDMEKELPGPIVYDTQGVIDAVRTSDCWMEERKEQYEAFYERFCAWEDGNAAERVVEALLGEKGADDK